MSHVSFRGVQSTHVAPFDPQAASMVPAWHAPLASQHPWHVAAHGQEPPSPPKPVWQLPFESQHPVGHVAGPHTKPTHAPFEQADVAAAHDTHRLPPKPHSLFAVPAWQLSFASQHPSQVSSLQPVSTQLPAMHWEVPSHWLQKEPPLPQSNVWLPGWQAPLPSQHPPGQLPALQNDPSHVPPSQNEPVLQVAHWVCDVPHAAFVVPGWQMSFSSQQPSTQLSRQVEPTHAWPTHASPAGQDAHATPPVPQSLRLVPGLQAPVASQQPSGHVIGLQADPWQAPAVHLSPATHTPHVLPPAPHAAVDSPGSQVPV